MNFPIYPLPAYLDPTFIRFSENLSPPPTIKTPRLLGTEERVVA